MQLQAEMATSLEDFMRRPGCPVLAPPSKEVSLMQIFSWLCCCQLEMGILVALLLESEVGCALWKCS